MALGELQTWVEAIYAATLSPGEWPQVIDRLCRRLGADHTLLSHATEDRMFVASTGLDQPDLDRFVAFSPVAGRLAPTGAVPELYAPGKVISSADILSDAEVEGSAFYNEVIRPAKGFYSLTSVGSQASTFNLSICRGRKAGPFDDAAALLVESLAPHIATALELHHRLRAGERREAGYLALLDRHADGVILCEGSAAPAYMNRRAEGITADDNGLGLGAQGLIGSTPAETRRLRAAIAEVADDSVGSTRRLALRRRSGGLPLVLSLLPVWRLGRAVGEGPSSVAIFVQEPGAPPPVSSAVLSDLFGLTRREAEVARHLTSGANPAQIAARMDLGVGTVRSHLKQVFAKTGARSQVALAALIHSCAGVWG